MRKKAFSNSKLWLFMATFLFVLTGCSIASLSTVERDLQRNLSVSFTYENQTETDKIKNIRFYVKYCNGT